MEQNLNNQEQHRLEEVREALAILAEQTNENYNFFEFKGGNEIRQERKLEPVRLVVGSEIFLK